MGRPAGWRRRPYLQTGFSERDGRLSPDERWMAYTSDEAGRDAIYVRLFPDAAGGKWRVSGSGGGVAAGWRADGKEIFYVDDSGRIIAVRISCISSNADERLPEPYLPSHLQASSERLVALHRF